MSGHEKLTGEQELGCVLSAWSLLVTGPLWLALLFTILQAADVPDYAWWMYWGYVPACLLGTIFGAICKAVRK